MIKLYHGTIADFDHIDLTKGRGYKDFGKGFYATPDSDQAEKLARKGLRYLKKTRSPEIIAYRYNLIFDDKNAEKSLKIKTFSGPNLEWIRFIVENRKSDTSAHDYDVVIGPTADADTFAIINTYGQELIDSDFDLSLSKFVIQQMHPERLSLQYFFGTVAALQYLSFDQNDKRKVIV